MTFMLGIAKVVYVLACVLIIGSVLLQESKGGGLAGLGGTRAEAAFGASNPLRRLTVVLSVIFFVLAGLLTLTSRPSSVSAEGEEPAATAPETPGETSGEKADKKAPETGGESAKETGDAAEGGTTEGSPEPGGNP